MRKKLQSSEINPNTLNVSGELLHLINAFWRVYIIKRPKTWKQYLLQMEYALEIPNGQLFRGLNFSEEQELYRLGKAIWQVYVERKPSNWKEYLVAMSSALWSHFPDGETYTDTNGNIWC